MRRKKRDVIINTTDLSQATFPGDIKVRPTVSCYPGNMEPTLHQQLIKQQAVARGMLSRIQNLIEAGDQKLNDIQVRFNKLPDIFNRYDTAQSELELSDDTDHSDDRELFENQYYHVETKCNELLHPAVELPQPRHSSSRSSSSERRNNSLRSHSSSVHIKLPVISLLTFDGNTCSWLQYRHV
jgi:hypothetical protein